MTPDDEADASILHILAPLGRDGATTANLLSPATGLRTEVSRRADDLGRLLGDRSGAIVIAEEALYGGGRDVLKTAMEAQPTWSDYPVIFLAARRQPSRFGDRNAPIVPDFLTNVLILERPTSSSTLISAVRWALTSRRRQFATRDHLREIEDQARHQTIMTRELAHRVKNTIAILQSIANQTIRGFPGSSDAREILIARFSALAKTHDLLLTQNFKSAELREVVEQALSIHDLDGAQTRIEGGLILLSPQSALSMALVVHELATNALKYGALSCPEGLVNIRWYVSRSDKGEWLRLRWQETGGPSPVSPETLGFGSKLIAASLESLGSYATDFTPEGFQLVFDGELAKMTSGDARV